MNVPLQHCSERLAIFWKTYPSCDPELRSAKEEEVEEYLQTCISVLTRETLTTLEIRTFTADGLNPTEQCAKTIADPLRRKTILTKIYGIREKAMILLAGLGASPSPVVEDSCVPSEEHHDQAA